MFDRLDPPEPDALHRVMERYSNDPRAEKMDLGVGVYRTEDGTSPIMNAVRRASAHLLETERTKAYTALRGIDAFLDGMRSLIGAEKEFDRVAMVQSVGGTGGLRLALELARKAKPDLKVHIGTPTWPNHMGICNALGIEICEFAYFDQATQSLNIEAFHGAVAAAEAGDVIIFHGPCHNPTGADLTDNEYLTLINKAVAKGALPLIDAAYYGLGNDLDADLARMAHILERMPFGMLVMSCSKAFSLYRERTGILFVATPSTQTKSHVQGALETIGRRLYSLPPSFGASLVGHILSDRDLSGSWRSELKEMRERILRARSELVEYGSDTPALAAIGGQKGIFSLLPISERQSEQLGLEYGIHMPASGRINIAGLKTGDAERLASALAAVTRSTLIEA